MAADRAALARAEALVGAGQAFGPRMAWWAWKEPTISLGFLQPEGEVRAAGLPVVRRPTGGRAILHHDEWTVSILVPRAHRRLGGTLHASTRALVHVVATALAAAYGIVVDPLPGAEPVTEAAGPAGAEAAACFARSLGYELAVGGRKLMGSAQRRGRHVLLQQGSLLVGPGHERLARFLPGAAADAEATLAARAVTLRELLGRAPDPAPFARALAGAWSAAASGLRETPSGALDSALGHS